MVPPSLIRRLTSPAAIAFEVAFAVFLAVALLQGEKPFYYDAGVYWILSESFVADGSFSLLNFENTGIRGYALPLALHGVDAFGGALGLSDAEVAMFLNAALFALIGAVLAPHLAEIAWPQRRWGIAHRLALCALILAFWRGYLSYPLSDFPALAAGLGALIAVSRPRSPVAMLIAGGAAALALNFRPAYVVFVIAVVALAVWGLAENRDGAKAGRARLALCGTLFAAGFVLVSLPQSLSEHDLSGSYNPIPGGSGNLAGLQYTEGLRLQRYETYVGGSDAEVRMNYLDPHTTEIVAGLDDGEVQTTGEYARIVLENPVTMAGVFLRHLVNGLDQRYTTPYVEELQTRRNLSWRLAGFLIVLLALLRVAWPAGRRGLGPARWRYPAALLLASATTIASAVETRFMLPVFVLCAMLAVAPGWTNPLPKGVGGPARYRTLAILLAAGVVFYAIVLTIVAGATDNLQIDPV